MARARSLLTAFWSIAAVGSHISPALGSGGVSSSGKGVGSCRAWGSRNESGSGEERVSESEEE